MLAEFVNDSESAGQDGYFRLWPQVRRKAMRRAGMSYSQSAVLKRAGLIRFQTGKGVIDMANRSFRPARALFDIFGDIRSASRVAHAIETGRHPDQRDLEDLGIEEIFARKNWNVQDLRF